MGQDKYAIYQLKNHFEQGVYLYEPLEQLNAAGRSVDSQNYNHVYTGTLEFGEKTVSEILEALSFEFTQAHPKDYPARSLYVSDVITLHRDSITAAYYVDSNGFKKVPEFLITPYKYYPTQRPIDIGGFPKTVYGPVRIVKFDKREWMENATFRAWGYLMYDAPLTQKQIADYELRAASNNLDCMRVSPYQLAPQIEVIGKWETAHCVPDAKRLTCWHDDMGVFVKKEWASAEQVAGRFGQLIEMKGLTSKKIAAPKRIAAQMAEAGKQVQRVDKMIAGNKSGRDER